MNSLQRYINTYAHPINTHTDQTTVTITQSLHVLSLLGTYRRTALPSITRFQRGLTSFKLKHGDGDLSMPRLAAHGVGVGCADEHSVRDIAVQLLQLVVPQSRGGGPQRHREDHRQQPHHGRRHRAPLLPRLLRQGDNLI